MNSVGTDDGESEHFLYTTPGSGVYYLRVTGELTSGTTYRYRLRVGGPVGCGPKPGPGEPTPNNNRDASTAFGPLGGQLYKASIDGNGEQDWFLFYTSRAGTFDVAVTGTDDGRGTFAVSLSLRDGDGEVLNSISAGQDRRGHIVYTAPGAGRYFLQAVGSTGARYQLQITPASLLTSTPPPTANPRGTQPSSACTVARRGQTKARAGLKRARVKLKAAKGKAKSARGRRARRRARRVVKKRTGVVKRRRAAVRRKTAQVKTRCG